MASSSIRILLINAYSCGASKGTNPVYTEAARHLARAMHQGNMRLVYGGGTTGLMGEVAQTLVSLSGPDAVHGIIPRPLVRYEQEPNPADSRQHTIDEKKYGRTTVVADMHTRKRMMADEVIRGGPGGGFVALPGGFGTAEEMFEITTWNQLGIHDWPIVLFNVDGYWTGIIDWIQETAVRAGFISPANARITVEATNEDEVLSQLKNYQVASERFALTWHDELRGSSLG